MTPNGLPPHRARKSLGQNFLVDRNLQEKIVAAIDPTPSDEVLEIGPGMGALTRHLVERVGRLILVELDDGLVARLRDTYGENDRVTIVHGDILETELEMVSADPARLKVIGNIPYNITTPIIFHLLERRPRPAVIVLMVQKEVGERLLAAPGGRTYGALAVGVRVIADVEKVLNIPRTAFRPMPNVDSTVIRIVPHDPPRLDANTETSVRILTRAAFGQRRKQFQRILRDAFGLSTDEVEHLAATTGFDLVARPETFSPQQFISLARALEPFLTRGESAPRPDPA